MFFTRPNDFIDEPVKVAGISENGALQKTFSKFIGRVEKQALIDLLGDCLYNDLAAAMEFVDGAYRLREDAPQNIVDLVNGKSYEAPPNDTTFISNLWFFAFFTSCGCGCGSAGCTTREWKGIVQSDTYVFNGQEQIQRRSFLYSRIYADWLMANRSWSTGTGQSVLAGENASTVDGYSKRVDAWNDFIAGAIGYPNSTSLYRYLCDNKADYPNWRPNCNLRFKDKF